MRALATRGKEAAARAIAALNQTAKTGLGSNAGIAPSPVGDNTFRFRGVVGAAKPASDVVSSFDSPRSRKITIDEAWLREALRDVRARDAASTFERAPDRFPSSSIRRGAPDASSSSAARVVVPALGSFRFPKPSAINDAGADATIDPGAEEINHSERLRRLASAKRDPAVADALGKTFNDKALKAFHSPMRKHLTLDPLISEYSIDSPEGVALMSLAEALIRTPKTAKDMPRRLLRDTLAASHLDFLSHFAADKSVLVNASSVALSTVKRYLDGDSDVDHRGAFARGSDAVLEHGVRKSLGLLARKFTMGPNIESACARASRAELATGNKMHSFDMLGEGARTEKDAARYLAAYVHAGKHIARSGVRSPQMSVKLSSLSPRFDELSRRETLPKLVASLGALVGDPAARDDDDFTIFVDAEEQNRLELTLAVVEATVREHAPKSIGVVVQAYGRRAMPTLEYLRELATTYPGTKFKVRLVKGAYWDAEVKEAQVLGADAYPVWTDKRRTDVSYLACAAYLLDNLDKLPNAAFATHNARTAADVLAMAPSIDDFANAGCEFQRLHGMGESFDYAGLPMRVYAPVGAPDDLLAYLVRRLLENGANSSFLKRLADNKAELLDVDVLATPADDVAVIPASPRDVYAGKRLSAKGVDFEHPSFPLEFATTPTYDPSSRGTKAVVVDGSVESEAKLEALFARMRSFSPAANAPRVGGSVSETTTTDNPVLKRAGILRAAADIIERESVSITKLIMTEAGKTTADAVAELRECVDFFRFYADRAAETLAAPKTLPTVTGESCLMQAQPRGPWLCIGPFNFPFAIVGGLASSAYVAGNPVVIKPHPATRRCALALADVLHRAGMPEGEVAVVCDDVNPDASTAIVETGASDAGARLVGSGVFSGVSFVGGTRTAAKINHALATVALERPGAPLARFVAETGGLNVLVADASALPEQVSDAVIASFAAAAGQRCSSARILVLDEGCKDAVVGMLAGGLKALRVSSDTLDVSTDVGPLISASAKAKATAHCAALEANGATLLCATTDDLAAADADAANPRLFHPRAYELPNGEDGLDLLIDETFAPVLHVVTYDGSAESLKRVIDRVNAKGFALTGGVLTRCDSTKALVASTLDCGNFYVNRDVVGAVVESQPFGGHGLSGNGVKAGSEGYLEQFVSHKVVCEDTTASGGNVELLRGGGD